MSYIEIHVGGDGDGYGQNNGGGGNNGSGMAALMLVIIALVVCGFLFRGQVLGALQGSSGEAKAGPASANIDGAIPCKTSPGGRHDNVNLTKERLPACVKAKQYAKAVVVDTYKNAETEFECLDKLWTKESQWSAWAENPSSKAFGIAQIHPGVHKTNIPDIGDWKGQVDWGLKYINGRYKTPCGAWKFWLNPTVHVPGASKNWY